VQPTNYVGGAESDIKVNLKDRATHMDLTVPNIRMLREMLN